MKRLSFTIILASIFLGLTMHTPALAKLGVGVATGKIVVDELLYPGTIYNLPPLNVLNTGDETATYHISITYHESQPEKKPALDWFAFKPNDFELKQDGAQPVGITLQIPIKAEPGKYFAYLEASPVQKSSSGSTSIGIAAATKLYFEIAPANIFIGLYYRILTFWTNNLPWTNIVAAMIIGLIIIRYVQTHFNFNISKKSKSSSEKDE